MVGALFGALAILLIERVRQQHDPDEAELLSERVSDYLGQLESRLAGTIQEKGKEA